MKSRGFTLIELLVVVSIIGILSSIVLTSLSAARSRARDSERKQNLVQLRNALELYNTTNGEYPKTPSGSGYYWWGRCATFGTHTNDWIPNLTNNLRGGPFIAKLPVDPKPMTSPYAGCDYLYLSNGKDYKLLVYGITESNVAPNSPWYRFPAPSADASAARTFSVYSNRSLTW